MRHAYLIMAHEYNFCLRSLIKCIDDKRNDIYVHVDKKARYFPFEELRKAVSFSRIFFVKRTNSNWASFGLVRAELVLLETAAKEEKYAYYHLLSGADLPLKSQNDIHKYFQEYSGYQFVEYVKNDQDYDRIQYSYFLQNIINHGSTSIVNRGLMKIQRTAVSIQKKMNLKKNKRIDLYRGAQWFSITDEFAHYVIQSKHRIQKIFNNTLCPDELFIQTILAGSPFEASVFNRYENQICNSMRYIDWKRGNPYVFRIEDYEQLVHSDMMFARKFSETVDRDIIEQICVHCTSN